MFEAYLTKTSDQVAWEIYNRKANASDSATKPPSVEEIRQISKETVDPLIAQYKPIAFKIIHDAGYNTNGDYYVYDNTTQKWHLPGQSAPSTPVDGAALNAQHLSQELERAFKQLISSKSGINKRGWLPAMNWNFLKGRLSGVSEEMMRLIRNLEASSIEEAFKKADEYKFRSKEWNDYNEAWKKAWKDTVDSFATARKDFDAKISDGPSDLSFFTSKSLHSPEAADNLVSEMTTKIKDYDDSIKSLTDDLSKLEKNDPGYETVSNQIKSIQNEKKLLQDYMDFVGKMQKHFDKTKPRKTADQQYLDDFLGTLEAQRKIRSDASDDIKQYLALWDENPSEAQRKIALQEKLDELRKKPKSEQVEKDIAVLEAEIKHLDSLIQPHQVVLTTKIFNALKTFFA